MKSKKKSKPFSEMNAKELAEATAKYDAEFIEDSFGPMPPEEREWFEQARKRGRPRRGHGAKVISVSVEKGLLTRSDALAKKRRMSRSALIEVGLLTVLAREDENAESTASHQTKKKRQKRRAV